MKTVEKTKPKSKPIYISIYDYKSFLEKIRTNPENKEILEGLKLRGKKSYGLFFGPEGIVFSATSQGTKTHAYFMLKEKYMLCKP